jgi:hypothetical protein
MQQAWQQSIQLKWGRTNEKSQASVLINESMRFCITALPWNEQTSHTSIRTEVKTGV